MNVQHLDVPSRIRIAFLHVVFLIINDWKTPIITCLILLLRKNEATLCCDRRQPSARFRTLTELFFCSIEITMLTIRFYICALTSLFLLLAIVYRSVGIFEAIVITCALLYLILDVRSDLQSAKTELRCLKELEKQVSLLLR